MNIATKIALSLSVLGAVACSSGPDSTRTAVREHAASTKSALSDAAQYLTGSYQLANKVQGQPAWRLLNLVGDGSFNGFQPCKVPACSEFRTTGTWDYDDYSSTLTLAFGSTRQSFTLWQGWDGGYGIELTTDSIDEQLAYVAATCVAVSDCDGQTVLGAGSTTCGEGFQPQTACDSNVCDTACKPIPCSTDADCSSATVCFASSNGSFCTVPRTEGQTCGFRTQNQPCARGLVCQHSTGPLDTLTCVKGSVTPDTSCLSDADCADGQTCFFASGQCGGSGSCSARPFVCQQTCGDVTKVCGCDGNTYCNACLASQSGVSVFAQGACN